MSIVDAHCILDMVKPDDVTCIVEGRARADRAKGCVTRSVSYFLLRFEDEVLQRMSAQNYMSHFFHSDLF